MASVSVVQILLGVFLSTIIALGLFILWVGIRGRRVEEEEWKVVLLEWGGDLWFVAVLWPIPRPLMLWDGGILMEGFRLVGLWVVVWGLVGVGIWVGGFWAARGNR